MDIKCNMLVNLNLVRRIYSKKLDNELFQILLEFDGTNFAIIDNLSAEQYEKTYSLIEKNMQLALIGVPISAEQLEMSFEKFCRKK